MVGTQRLKIISFKNFYLKLLSNQVIFPYWIIDNFLFNSDAKIYFPDVTKCSDILRSEIVSNKLKHITNVGVQDNKVTYVKT